MILSYIDRILLALYFELSKCSLFAIPKSAGYGAVDAYKWNKRKEKFSCTKRLKLFRKLLEYEQENQMK